MLSDIKTFYDFESLVFRILSETRPLKLDHRTGGRDRGRDIVVHYKVQRRVVKVVVECKYYTRPLRIRDISNSVDWAKIYKPDLLYFWICPHLTNDAKDYLESFANSYSIAVDYEDAENISTYQSIAGNGARAPFQALRQKILTRAGELRATATEVDLPLEYETRIRGSGHLLIDRKDEVRAIRENRNRTHYLVGLPGCGKSQVLKHVAHLHHQKGEPVFWHTIMADVSEAIQIRSFYESLAAFFRTSCRDSRLSEYFASRDTHLVNGLLVLLEELVRTHRPVLVVDDLHCCRSSALKELFLILARGGLTKILYAGWWSVFPEGPAISPHFDFVQIGGLKREYLEQLVSEHASGDDRPTGKIVELIQQEYDSLPFYALFADRIQAMGGAGQNRASRFFETAVAGLPNAGVVIVAALIAARSPIPLSVFAGRRELTLVRELSARNVLAIEGTWVAVHDNIRNAAKSLLLDSSHSKKVPVILIAAGRSNPGFLLDAIGYLFRVKEVPGGLKLLEAHFNVLMDAGYDVDLLTLLNQGLAETQPTANLILKKLMILERMGQYQLAAQLVGLFQSSIPQRGKVRREWEYNATRIRYFNDEIAGVKREIESSIARHVARLDPLDLQTLFLLGRCYYTQGEQHAAATVYLLVFQSALGTDRSLAIKALHRLAMIEEVGGLYREALATFKRVLETADRWITKKRRSYVLYRIAKCQLKLGDLDAAVAANRESIEIKESFNHLRGLAFSYKLQCMIELQRGKSGDAIALGEKSRALAASLHLTKEVVACGIALARALLAAGRFDDADDTIRDCVENATKLGLVQRLAEIRNLCRHYQRAAVTPEETDITVLKSQEAPGEAAVGLVRQKLNPFMASALRDFEEQRIAITPRLRLG